VYIRTFISFQTSSTIIWIPCNSLVGKDEIMRVCCITRVARLRDFFTDFSSTRTSWRHTAVVHDQLSPVMRKLSES